MVHRRLATTKEVKKARELLVKSYHGSGKSPTRHEVNNVLHSFGLRRPTVRHRKHRRR